MYRVRLQDFEGPLDLLLYFIRRDELDIYNIPIAHIADEFLAYVRVLEDVDLDSVGDFIYMAAQLIDIKARMLLPVQETDEEGEPIDPRRELVERLLSYIRYKEAADILEERLDDRNARFARDFVLPDKDRMVAEQEVEFDVSVFGLITALKRILELAPEETRLPLPRNEYTLESQQAFIVERLAHTEQVSFIELVQRRPKAFIIVTFLVALELARLGHLELLLPPDGRDFYLRRKESLADLRTDASPPEADPTPPGQKAHGGTE